MTTPGIRIGKHDIEFEVLTRPRISDGQGGTIASGTEVVINVIFGAIRTMTARERATGMQLQEQLTHMVETRWIDDAVIDTDMVLQLEKLTGVVRRFKIIGVENKDEADVLALIRVNETKA